MLATARTALADSTQITTYSAQETIPVPPASSYAGGGGGDGWAVALSSTQVFNVFHHNATMTVACHLQTTSKACFGDPLTGGTELIQDAQNDNFATSGHAGLWLDQNTGKLYVYGTRTSDETAGVVCIDTALLSDVAGAPSPFCGFTPLVPAGAGAQGGGGGGESTISGPALIGSHWYAFNFVPGKTAGGGRNQLLCFDTSTLAACAGQPFDLGLTGADSDTTFPPPAVTAIGTHVIIPGTIGGVAGIDCFDDTTQAVCSGTWPVAAPSGYIAGQEGQGAAFPLLSPTGVLEGFCLPTGTDQCFDFTGTPVTPPNGMTGAIPENSPWNGPAFVLGPRVYLPNGSSNQVNCFDYSTSQTCSGFAPPNQCGASFVQLGVPQGGCTQDLELMYTANADPQRPTCIWLNSDGGTSQIQNFDAFTGQACGFGAIRAVASKIVVNSPVCLPATYQSLQILQPAPGSYASGSVAFEDADGNTIPGATDRPLDATGTVDLTGLSLNSALGLPQFLITLNGATGPTSSVLVKLTWTATADPSCDALGATSSTPAVTPQAPPAGPTAPTIKPVLSGKRSVGQTLTCSTGTVTGNPTTFTYRWYRTGVQVSGATGSTYTLVKNDQGTIFTCQVTASNTAGSATGTSNALYIPLPPVAGCPPATGRMNGHSIGKVNLGMTRNRIRVLFSRHASRGRHFEDFFCLKPIGTRVGYSTPLLLKTLSKQAQKSLKGKVVWASTSNPFYSLDGVRPGESLKKASKKLGGTEKPFHIGHNYWYLARKGKFTAVLKVRHGEVQEIGIANNLLTATRQNQSVLMHSFF